MENKIAIFLDGKIARAEKDGALIFKAFGFDHFIANCESMRLKREDFGNWPWLESKTPIEFRKSAA